jgi:hypothetical protein
MGVGMAFIWAPLAATATRNLHPELAGAGSGVYNTVRQVGSVLGSAGIAAFMTSRISAEMGGGADAMNPEGSVTQLPAFLHEPFSAALSQALLLPAFVALLGVVAALFLRGAGDVASPNEDGSADAGPDRLELFTAELRGSRPRTRGERMEPRSARAVERQAPRSRGGSEYFHDTENLDAPAHPHDSGYHDEYFGDDDDYVEYTVDWDPPAHRAPTVAVAPVDPEALEAAYDAAYDVGHADSIALAIANAIDVDGPGDRDAGEGDDYDESDTEPLPTHVDHPLHAPAEAWHGGSADSWQHWVPDDEPPPVPARNGHAPRRRALDDWFGGTLQAAETDPIGLQHNGFRGKELRRGHVETPPPSRGGRHSRGDDDAGTYGRHSMPHGD